jgi:hypothetical protein
VEFDWHRASLPADVSPGAQVGVDLVLPPLDEEGDFLVVLDLVVEGLTWFSGRGSTAAALRVTVGSPGMRPMGGGPGS